MARERTSPQAGRPCLEFSIPFALSMESLYDDRQDAPSIRVAVSLSQTFVSGKLLRAEAQQFRFSASKGAELVQGPKVVGATGAYS